MSAAPPACSRLSPSPSVLPQPAPLHRPLPWAAPGGLDDPGLWLLLHLDPWPSSSSGSPLCPIVQVWPPPPPSPALGVPSLGGMVTSPDVHNTRTPLPTVLSPIKCIVFQSDLWVLPGQLDPPWPDPCRPLPAGLRLIGTTAGALMLWPEGGHSLLSTVWDPDGRELVVHALVDWGWGWRHGGPHTPGGRVASQFLERKVEPCGLLSPPCLQSKRPLGWWGAWGHRISFLGTSPYSS